MPTTRLVVAVAVASLVWSSSNIGTDAAAFCAGRPNHHRHSSLRLRVVSDPRLGIPLTSDSEETKPSSSSSSTSRRPTPETTTASFPKSRALSPQLPLLFVGTTASASSSSYTASDCDDYNVPPSLAAFSNSILRLKSGSDIRGQYVNHARHSTSLRRVLSSLFVVPTFAQRRRRQEEVEQRKPPPLTPLTAHCLGHAFATLVKTRCGKTHHLQICVGRDPRPSGIRLADAFCRGVESVEGVSALYTGLATTPSMFEFCRADKCDGAVMITASHLPQDRNGMKFFTKNGGFTKSDIDVLANAAIAHAHELFDVGILPPTSGEGAVFCSQWVDFMPHYSATLVRALRRELGGDTDDKPLEGLKIVLNAGNGAGYFFHSVLESLGADVSGSLGLTPDGTFPNDRVPNPEHAAMLDETRAACRAVQADLGIMLDTDADRCGLVVVSSSGKDYEPLHRNRLIALLSVIFATSSPGCTIVTDSVTSEGLSRFLQDELQLNHVRYLKGYANVIGKAKELTESGVANAEMAIETSGHCAMKENGYLDDGTYTAVKVIGLLGRLRRQSSSSSDSCLLDLIAALPELPETVEFRLPVVSTQVTTREMLDRLVELLELHAETRIGWQVDRSNQEGLRIVTQPEEGGFFQVRQSLHDPLLSVYVEGTDRENVLRRVVHPLCDCRSQDNVLSQALDGSQLEAYGKNA